jgi:hypothetical protein
MFEECFLSEMVWKKPVICIFKERSGGDWQSDPFVVIKAKQITLVDSGNDPKYSGELEDFFTLMGDADYLSSAEGKADHYVFCWFDDTEPDMTKDLRRLRGVRITSEVSCSLNEKTHKRTYNVSFSADQAKTE